MVWAGNITGRTNKLWFGRAISRAGLINYGLGSDAWARDADKALEMGSLASGMS